MKESKSPGLPRASSRFEAPMEGEFTTHSPDETFEIGRRLGEQIKEPAIFLLSGELGAGKTLFTKGLGAGLGIDPSDITSPSFTLVNMHEGRMRLYHVDLYRLDDASSFELGMDEILEEGGAVTVIEWAERLGYRPWEAIEVNIESISENGRRIRIRGFS